MKMYTILDMNQTFVDAWTMHNDGPVIGDVGHSR